MTQRCKRSASCQQGSTQILKGWTLIVDLSMVSRIYYVEFQNSQRKPKKLHFPKWQYKKKSISYLIGTVVSIIFIYVSLA